MDDLSEPFLQVDHPWVHCGTKFGGLRSEERVYSCSLAGIAGSNPVRSMEVCLL